MNRAFSFYEILGGEKGVKSIIDLANEKYNNTSWKSNYNWATPQIGLTFSVLTAQLPIAPMASYIDVNSPKPLRSVQGYGVYGGNIPKLGHGYDIEEQTMRDEMIVAFRNGDISVSAIADILFKHVDNLIQGAHSRLNYADDQLRSTGRIIINTTNNPDGVPISIDYRVPAENFLKAGFGQTTGLAWSDPNANPVKDLIDMVRFADDNYVVYDEFEMSKALWNTFAAHPNVLAWVRARLKISDDVSSYPLTEGDVKAALDGFNLPPVRIIDHKFTLELDGLPQAIRGFDEGNVVLRPSGILGEMKNAVSMHTLAPSTPTSLRTSIEGGRIAILNTWKDVELINHIELEGYAIPALNNPKNLVILDTTTAAPSTTPSEPSTPSEPDTTTEP